MKVAGVIAEFDPFHNGHTFFLRRLRKLTSADLIIAVMSGDYTQRGNIAIMGKRIRAKAALLNGADVVMELPVQYATASAELFALAGVSLLDSLSVVDHLGFGTEDEDMDILCHAADILSEETAGFGDRLQQELKKGMTYPEARLKALLELTEEDQAGALSEALKKPNNILAVEYLKAIKKLGSKIKPVNIKREAVDHDDTNTYGIYSSAGNIRNTIRVTDSLQSIEGYLPENTLPLLRGHFREDYPVYDDDLSLLLKYRLSMETEASLMCYADMSRELSHRIMNMRKDISDVRSFTELIKTRNLTYTRISRALLHVLLNVTKEDMRQYEEAGVTGYARILGFRKEASELIDRMNEMAGVPLISRLSDGKRLIPPPFDRMLTDTLRSSDIYNYVIKDIYGTDMITDISRMAVSEDGVVLF